MPNNNETNGKSLTLGHSYGPSPSSNEIGLTKEQTKPTNLRFKLVKQLADELPTDPHPVPYFSIQNAETGERVGELYGDAEDRETVITANYMQLAFNK